MYSGKANWDYIKEVKSALQIPVIGNGDVNSPESAKALLEYTGCDAMLIGRAAQGNPWLFRQIKEYLETGSYSPSPTGSERITMLLRHYELLCHYKGVDLATREIRTHASFYIKGLPEAARWRNALNVAMGRESFINVVNDYKTYLESRSGHTM
jgi:tRNA-dihydrouridine synthase